MKVIEDIARQYKELVALFLPHRISDAGEIGFQIERLKIDAEDEGNIYFDFRLKEEGNDASESKYLDHKNKNHGKHIDDVYIPVDGVPIYCGFSVKKI